MTGRVPFEIIVANWKNALNRALQSVEPPEFVKRVLKGIERIKYKAVPPPSPPGAPLSCMWLV
jgi:hypothetical protein